MTVAISLDWSDDASLVVEAGPCGSTARRWADGTRLGAVSRTCSAVPLNPEPAQAVLSNGEAPGVQIVQRNFVLDAHLEGVRVDFCDRLHTQAQGRIYEIPLENTSSDGRVFVH
jgi:hypothetical protein